MNARYALFLFLFSVHHASALFDQAGMPSGQGGFKNTEAAAKTGNWYEKLHWFKQAKPKYDQIALVVEQIHAIDAELQKKLVPLNDEVATFLTAQKIDKVTLEKNIQSYLSQVSKKLSDEPIDVEEEKTKEYVFLSDQKKAVESVQQQADVFFTFHERVNQAIRTILPGQVQQAIHYEEQALADFETIEQIFDDKKARELFESIDTASENVLAIKNYLDGSLRQYINEAVGRIAQLMTELQKNVDSLQQEGVYLRAISQQEIDRLEKERMEKEQKHAQKEPRKQPEPIEKGWFVRFFGSIWHYITLPFTYLYHLIV